MTAIIFDEDGSFANMSVPNKKFSFAEFPDLQPIGMPLKTLEPGNIGININHLDKGLFREVIRVIEKPESYLGKDSAELLDSILEKEKGKIKKIEELEQLLLKVKEEEKMFHIYRAIRWVRVLSRIFPGYIQGKLDMDSMVSAYMRTSGAITRIDLDKLPLHIKKAFIYSVMRSLYEEYSSQKVVKSKIIGIIPMGEKYLSKNPKKKLDTALVDVLMKCEEVGVEFATSAAHEVDILPTIVDKATMQISFVQGFEAAIKGKKSKPYRATMRPRLSA
jgi:hypothetical protein